MNLMSVVLVEEKPEVVEEVSDVAEKSKLEVVEESQFEEVLKNSNVIEIQSEET